MSGSKTVQFPPQTGPYKVTVHQGADWQDYTAARLQISVGMPNHEGEKFRATCAWVAARFKEAVVEVSDTLQRHNLVAAGMSVPEAYEQSLAAGDAWLARNRDALALLPAVTLNRWEKWLRDDRFPARHAFAMALYDTHDGFRADIDAAADRFSKKDETQTADRRRQSVAFLLEEAAVYSLQQEDKVAADIYPGTYLDIFSHFRDAALARQLPGLADRHFTRIDFVRRRA